MAGEGRGARGRGYRGRAVVVNAQIFYISKTLTSDDAQLDSLPFAPSLLPSPLSLPHEVLSTIEEEGSDKETEDDKGVRWVRRTKKEENENTNKGKGREQEGGGAASGGGGRKKGSH